ncbi:MAG: helix-turn-helix domain-containing protein [Nitrososphaera sp.]|nr:helix-turn-helix domain-containing protein [Nitrososphaera sp.]
MERKKKFKSETIQFLYERYIRDNPERLASLEEERANADIARKIYELRIQAGLTQRQLAKLVGTSASAICRLEDADYEGHSLAMLRRIAKVLNKRVEIRFVSNKRSQQDSISSTKKVKALQKASEIAEE